MSTVEPPSYDELAALVVVLTQRLAQAEAQIAALRAEERRVHRGSTDDSTVIVPAGSAHTRARFERRRWPCRRVARH